MAGRYFAQEFTPGLNLHDLFVWDGLDVYGRRVRGEHRIFTRIAYIYDGVYDWATPNFGALGSGFDGIQGRKTRKEIVLAQSWSGSIGGWDAHQPQDVGGWSLNVHHAYDPKGRVLYMGDGERRSAQSLLGSIITTATGTGSNFCAPLFGCGDGGPATQAALAPVDVSTGPDGSLYIADAPRFRVRQVQPNGIIITVAGSGQSCNSSTMCGDGGPATQAQLTFPQGVAVGPDGTLYIADSGTLRIRQVRPNGIITTVAGNGQQCPSATAPCGDGGPAIQAQFSSVSRVAVGADGSLYITDTDRSRRVGTDGIMSTVAGTGQACTTQLCGDGGPATQAQLRSPAGMTVGPDGSLYIADLGNKRIRRVGLNGVMTTVVGTGVPYGNSTLPCGDGGSASQAQLLFPEGLAFGPDGSIYIADGRLRQVGPDGIITTVAGSGQPCASPTSPCGDGGPATQAQMSSLTGVAVGPDGSVYIANFSDNRVRQVTPLLRGLAANDFLFAAADGSEVYVFNEIGRHLRTLHGLTGAVLYQFAYSATGRLISVTDGDGNVTTIERDTNSNPTAIVGPYGQRTTLAVDAHSYLAHITNPAGETVQLSSTDDGLLTSFTDARGNAYHFTYDALGRLVQDADPAGGFKALTRTETDLSSTVSLSTALGRTTTYQVASLLTGNQHRVNTFPDGTRTDELIGTDGSWKTTLADGTTTNLLEGPDPAFPCKRRFPRA